ncbi:uncharacterized protein PY1_contig_09_13 [Novosphingobium sp. PY1]|nr:uncharacterized protein PY1_contig_09_13 [Novosphingobium sp. PY1]
MVELQFSQPPAMRTRPWPASSVDPPVTQQEQLELLTSPFQRLTRRFPGPHQIAHCFMRGVGNPHSSQLAGAM